VAKGDELLARFKPGDNLPVYATGTDIVAGRFVTISGKNSKGAYIGAHTGAGLRADGVAETDAIAGKTDWRGGTNLARKGSIARVECGAAISVGALVQSDANGKAVPYVAPNTTTAGTPIATTPVPLGRLLGRNLTAGGAITADTQIGEIDLF
jgi:hypothetical protein